MAHERQRESAAQAQAGSADANTRLSRFGTVEYAPLWNGPRLRAPFIALVLGQAFPREEVMLSPSYRAASAPAGLPLDEIA